MEEKKYKSIVLTGGGTAGHVMPNLALVPLLKNYFEKIYYLGTKNGIEYQILSSNKEIEFITIDAVKFRRKLSFSLFSLPFKLINSIRKTKRILKQIKPNIVFSKGGYVSIPVAISAKKLNIPVISHESDMTMGLANKIIYHYSVRMCTSFKSTATKNKTLFTGSPIRQQIFLGKGQKLKNSLELKNLPTLLFFGGSIGAKAINALVWNNIDKLTEKYNVLHIVGKNNVNKNIKKQNYKQFEFVENIQDFFDLCDIAICRSGANTLFELIALNKPALLIPLPKLESRGDQIENANYFNKLGFFEILEQNKANSHIFLEKIEKILKNKEKYAQKMKNSNYKNSNQKIVELILKYSN